jgi:hypothetical protein
MKNLSVLLAMAWLSIAGTGLAQQQVSPPRDTSPSVVDEGAKADSDQAKKQARKERREHRKAINHRHRRKH